MSKSKGVPSVTVAFEILKSGSASTVIDSFKSSFPVVGSFCSGVLAAVVTLVTVDPDALASTVAVMVSVAVAPFASVPTVHTPVLLT